MRSHRTPSTTFAVGLTPLQTKLKRDGYALVEGALNVDRCIALRTALADIVPKPGAGGERNLLRRPEIIDLCREAPLASLVAHVLGRNAFAYKATFFDKTPQANWKVAWHQDLSIPVRGDARPEGWKAWSVKAEVLHAQPPAELLTRVLAVRVHLDECSEHTGALRVIPGSHSAGRLGTAQVEQWKTAGVPAACNIGVGGVMLMKPLLLHASSAGENPAHRRVLHLEFAAEDLPEGLDWAQRIFVRN
jgi:ectoine hydroxylase-related dioxygenase (phytanoyl-CoA dioxygenase family)